MRNHKDSEHYKKTIVNSTAGLIAHLSTGIFYPLELIKLRLQGKLLFNYIYYSTRGQSHENQTNHKKYLH